MIASHNHHRPISNAWRTSTVQTFFAQFPWDGPPQVGRCSQDDQTAAPIKPLFQQTVGAFFQQFPWDSASKIAAPALPLSVQQTAAEATATLTLDDFSSLF